MTTVAAWRPMTEHPDHDNLVLLVNQWGDYDYDNREVFPDGSVGWVRFDDTSRHMWMEYPLPPSKEEWK